MTLERLMAKVDTLDNGCWQWTGARYHDGYGMFSMGKTAAGNPRPVRAHRAAYELLVGPIPDGQDIDHICHNADRACIGGVSDPHRRCVNPSHLAPATRSQNVRNGAWGRVTHCKRGHPFAGVNLRLLKDGHYRRCRACDAIRNKAYRERCAA